MSAVPIPYFCTSEEPRIPQAVAMADSADNPRALLENKVVLKNIKIMRYAFIFLSFFALPLLPAGCERDDMSELLPEEPTAARSETLADETVPKHCSYLIWLDGSDGKARMLAKHMQAVNHYDTLLSLRQLSGPDPQKSLLAIARDSLNDVTLVGSVRDFAAGTYAPSMIQELRHLRRGIVLAAEGGDEELKPWLLRLLGVYVAPGYYKVCYPREQRYYFYDMQDPEALKKLCGSEGLPAVGRSFADSAPVTDDTSDPEVTERALHAMKRIYIDNRFYAYTTAYDYPMTGYEPLRSYTAELNRFSPLPDRLWDAAADREWVIDAYNLRIYAPTTGENLLAVYTAGGNGFANKIRNATVYVQNPPKNEVWGLLWGLRNAAYTHLRIFDAQGALLNLAPVDFAPGLPQEESTVSHSQSRSVGFDLGVKPDLKGEYRWGKSITYQLKEMTREVSKTQTDAELAYTWKWYPETLFRGSRALKTDGMVDGAAMISPAWYDILYNMTSVGKRNLFCDYESDPQFNQNLLNYQQECAVTAKTNGASAGVVGVEIEDGMSLQRGGVWFNSWGTPSAHPLPNDLGIACDALLDVHTTRTVWIDYNNW